MKGHNPNDGENQIHHSGATGGKRSMPTPSAGVSDGLSSNESFDTKNAEKVTQNQRPKGNVNNIGGGMKIGC